MPIEIIVSPNASAPVVRMAKGSPPAWELTAAQYARATRTYYVSARMAPIVWKGLTAHMIRDSGNRLLAATVDGGPLEGVTLAKVMPGSEHTLLIGDDKVKTLSWDYQCDDPGYKYDTARYLEVEGEDDLRILDWLDLVPFYDLQLRPILMEPPWHQDMLQWFRGLYSVRGIDLPDSYHRFSDWDSSLLRTQSHMRNLALHYAKARGYDLMVTGPTSGVILSPEKFRVVRLYEYGLTPWTTRCQQVHDAATTGVRVSQEILHECQKPSGVGGGGDYAGAVTHLAEAERLVAVLDRLCVVLRQRERTSAQDADLDRMSVQAALKCLASIASATLCASRGRQGLWLTRVLRLMKVPEIVPGPSGNDLEDVVAFLGDLRRGISDAKVHAQMAVNIAMGLPALESSIEKVSDTLLVLLAILGWPQGEKFILDAVSDLPK